MSKDPINSDVIICLSDLWLILKRKRRLLFLCATVSAVLFFGSGLFKTPTFSAQATFREKQGRGGGVEAGSAKSLLSMLAPLGGASSSFAIPILNSRVLVGGAIEDCGLQVQVRPAGKSLTLLSNLRDNIFAQMAFLRNRASSVVDRRIPKILFENVCFNENYSKAFVIRFTGDSTFDFVDPSTKKYVSGVVGKPCIYEGIKFTVVLSKADTLKGSEIPLVFTPMHQTLQRVFGSFSTKVDKKQEDFIQLSYSSVDPLEGARFLNVLMHKFNDYIKQENNEISNEQISFLDRARKRSTLALEEHFKEYEEFAVNSVGGQGVISAEDAIRLWALPQQELRSKKMYLESELASLNAKERAYQHSRSPSFLGLMSQLDKEIQELTLRRRSLEGLLKHKALDRQDSKTLVDHYHKKMKKHEAQSEEISSLIRSLKQKEPIPRNLAILEDADSPMSQWVSGISNEVIKDEAKRVELIQYLERLLEGLQIKEKVLKEGLRPTHFGELAPQGITLESAEHLYTNAINQMNQLKLRKAQIQQALKKIEVPGFEVSSLSSIFNEDVIRQMIGRAGQLVVQLQDDKNYSPKEKKRVETELRLQKQAIKLYLENNRELLKLEEKSIKGRIYEAQKASFDLINLRIALLKHQMEEAICARKSDLNQEIRLIDDQLEQIKAKMCVLPNKWLKEKKLGMYTDLQSEMMKTLATLVESKRISANLDVVESRPIDQAVVPIRPYNPKLLLKGIMGWILGYLLCALVLVVTSLARGIEVSAENLRVRKFHLGGVWNLGAPFESQLDVLRRAMSHIMPISNKNDTHSQEILWLGGDCPTIYGEMAKLFLGQGKKTLVIGADFKAKHSGTATQAGLLQYFQEGKAPSIIKKNGIDYIAPGGNSLMGPEYLLTEKFQALLKKYSGSYEQVIVYSDVNPASSSARLLLSTYDRIVASLCDEKIDDIERIYGSMMHSKHITFICFEKASERIFVHG